MSGFRRRSPLPAGAVLIALACFCGQTSAQTPTTGAVTGRVAASDGDPLYQALVTLHDTAAGTSRTTFTQRSGTFAFDFLAPGDYDLLVESVGFVARRLPGIPVRPGETVGIVAVLESGTGNEPSTQLVEVAQGRPGASQWLPEFAIRGVPMWRRSLDELTRLASSADDAGSVEGLPSSFSMLMLDGTPFRPVSNTGAGRRTSVFALSSARTAQLLTSSADVEWGGAAGGWLSVHGRSGSDRTHAEGVAYWSGDALPAGSSIDPGAQSFTDLQGGFVLRAPLMSDSARVILGVEARQLEIPLTRAWADTEAVAALESFAAGEGVELGSYANPVVSRHRSVSGFARLDWSVAADHRLEVATHFATLPEHDGPVQGLAAQPAGADFVAGGLLRSRFGTDIHNELRVAVTRAARELAHVDSVPLTLLSTESLRFGGAARDDAEETLIRATDAVHYRTGAHALKFGAGFTFGSYRYDSPPAPGGTYAFGDVDELMAGTGAFSRTEGPTAFADWTSGSVAVFAQDRFRALDGVDVLIGVRAERETLPSNVQRDAQWFQLTGLANDAVDGPRWRVAPRVGLTWGGGGAREWLLHASGGLHFDRFDPRLLAGWQTDDGSNDVRRMVGAVAWPGIAPAAGVTAPRLTLLGPDFDAPRTARVSAGLMRAITAATSIHLGGVFRRTENLPRRTDLNLLQLPAFEDQHGRPVFGTLVQQGALVVADPGSNRRFTEYDEVAALSADGWSDHWNITAGLDVEVSAGLGLLARYTYGRTTDNWFGAAQGSATISPPAGLEDWDEGSSDFDRPHRAVVGAVANVLPFVRVAALYRMQSGLPFTPSLAPGIDVNADGVAGNDPAFVDDAIPGMDDLVARWPCLRESAGRFADRNSCRGDMTHSLDLGLSVRVVRFGSGSASLLADFLDVLESAEDLPDAALYRIDAGTSLTSDPVARTVTVPLVVNPGFGEPLDGRRPGRRFRLGLSLNW